jgi:hypothetical protein
MSDFIEECTMCGEETDDITVVDDETRVCPDCLEDEFFHCDECGEYWLCDAKDSVELEDGRTVCADCAAELDEGDDDDVEAKFERLLHKIGNDPKYNGCVFEDTGFYFVVYEDGITCMTNMSGDTPKGGSYLYAVSGPTEEEHNFIENLMTELNIDEDFFSEMIDAYWEFNEEDALEFFEEQAEEVEYDEEEDATKNLETYKKIVKAVSLENSPFESMEAFYEAFERDPWCEPGVLYYKWEGEYFELYDNICEVGESWEDEGSYDIEEWIEILEDIDNYIVKA